MTSNLHFDEGDYSEENTCENEVFHSTILHHRKKIKYYLAQDLGFKIQDSRFKKESMKMLFKKVPDFRKSKYVSTIVPLY